MVEGAQLLVPLALVVVADQAIKVALTTALADGRTVGSLVRLRLVRGSTIAAALRVPRWILALVWLATVGAVAVLGPETSLFDSPAARIALGAALGGAAGNLLDHPLHGGVVDYLDVRIWPAFNLADAAIVVGVIVALASGVLGGPR